MNKRVVGASTITQQVVKNLLLSNELSYSRKIKEIILAIRIENILDKNDILELYLNDIYLGYGFMVLDLLVLIILINQFMIFNFMK